MPWIVGVDEAGYGPNLGPFVMTAVACRIPAALVDANLWRILTKAVRKQGDPADDRLAVDDSKLLNSASEGWATLGRHVLAALPPEGDDDSVTLAHYLEWAARNCHAEVRGEVWYTGQSPTLDRTCAQHRSLSEVFRQTCTNNGVSFSKPRSAIVCPARFNELLDKWGSKGAVLGNCLGMLLRDVLGLDDADSMAVYVDKHGGRNRYAPMLQQEIGDGMVMARSEGSLRSVYEVVGLKRSLRLTFQPRAESEHFCVALASMVSKFLREALMAEFNQFWQQHIPGVLPTAGYPNDASRFFEAIRPAVTKLGLAERSLWRLK